MRDGRQDYASNSPDTDPGHLTPYELSRRWRLSGRTLEKWRQRRVGPRYLRVGGRILYPHAEVTAYEIQQLRGGR